MPNSDKNEWLVAFREWLKAYCQSTYPVGVGGEVDPEYVKAYKLAFRAGWRARGRFEENRIKTEVLGKITELVHELYKCVE